MQQSNNPIITNKVMNTTINSSFTEIHNCLGYCIAAVYTGTPTGTLKLQACNDPLTPSTGLNPINWDDITGSSFSVISAGTYIWNVNNPQYTFVRLVYTDSSGGTSTAVLNANINIRNY